MTMVEATETCLRKYVVFSGRGSRAEFWKFVLAIFLATILASIANVLVFGPVVETEIVIRTTSEGTSQGFQNSVQYGPGPFSNILGLVVLIPFIAAANRRLHDIGRPGWHLVLCWVVALLLIVWTLYAFRTDIPVSAELRAAVPSMGETITVPQPPMLLFFVAWLTGFSTLILSIVWLARRGQDGPNRFGPDPMASKP